MASSGRSLPERGADASATTSASCSGTAAWRRPTWPSGTCSTGEPSSGGWARGCTTVEPVIVLERYDQLDLDEYHRIVRDHEPLKLAAGLERHVEDRRRAMERFLAGGASAYGVTTGLGYLAARSIAAEDRLSLQRSIVVGRAVAVGAPLPEEVVRGALLLRLTGFLSGHAGVTPELCRFIADRLNDGW